MLVTTLLGCEARLEGSGELIYEKARAASLELLIDGRLEGSGWLADPEGLVIVAAHTLWDRKGSLELISPTLGRLPATRVAVDRGHDLALLRLPPRTEGYPTLPIAEDIPQPGRAVYLHGSAMFRHGLMLRGAVARQSPGFEYLADQKLYARVYHVGAPSPPGTSGSCWLDERGRVVGNQIGMLSVNGVGVGIAMVAPPDAIGRLARSSRSASTPTVGAAFEELWEQPPERIARFPDARGGLVPLLIQADGPAQRGGLREGTLVTAVDGHPVRYRDELLGVIRAKRPGDEVTLRVVDPDRAEPHEVKLRLAALEREEPS
jgi:S1-C subfamily serine protease